MVDPARDSLIKFTLKLKASDLDELVEVERDIAAESCLLAYYMKVFTEEYLHAAYIPILNVQSETLGKVLSYCKYSVDKKKASAPSSHETWGYEMFSSLDDRMFNNLVLAAAYLQIESLLELSCNHATQRKPWGVVAAKTVGLEYLTYWEVVWTFLKQRREAREVEAWLAQEARKCKAVQTSPPRPYQSPQS